MPGVETEIWLAQKAAVKGIQGKPGDYPLAYPGEMYSPANAPYLRIGRASTAPDGQLIKRGAPAERLGSLIVTLVVPLSLNWTTENYDYIAGIIAAHFKDGTHMRYGDVCLTVTDHPHVQPGYDDENGYWSVPINIPWRTFA